MQEIIGKGNAICRLNIAPLKYKATAALMLKNTFWKIFENYWRLKIYYRIQLALFEFKSIEQ